MELLTYILIAVFSAAIGFAIGALWNYFSDDDGRREDPMPVPEVPLDFDSQESSQPLPGDLQPVASLLRQVKTGGLVVAFEEQIKYIPQDLNPREKSDLALAAADLLFWVNQDVKEIITKGRQYIPTAPTSTEDAQDSSAGDLGSQAYAALAGVSQFEVPSLPDPELQKTVVQYIDQVLQEMLERSPLKAKGIRLMELTDRGMVVVVGLDFYDSIEDVPDPAIQEVINAAVDEWERRQELDD